MTGPCLASLEAEQAIRRVPSWASPIWSVLLTRMAFPGRGDCIHIVSGNGGSRSIGLLVHISSLPGRFGIGDLGPEAHRFVASQNISYDWN